jgi:hypothetical protein
MDNVQNCDSYIKLACNTLFLFVCAQSPVLSSCRGNEEELLPKQYKTRHAIHKQARFAAEKLRFSPTSHHRAKGRLEGIRTHIRYGRSRLRIRNSNKRYQHNRTGGSVFLSAALHRLYRKSSTCLMKHKIH